MNAQHSNYTLKQGFTSD